MHFACIAHRFTSSRRPMTMHMWKCRSYFSNPGQFCRWDMQRGVYGRGAQCSFDTGKSCREPPSLTGTSGASWHGLPSEISCREPFLPLWGWEDWLAQPLMVLPLPPSWPVDTSEMILATCLTPPASLPPTTSSPFLPVKWAPLPGASSPSPSELFLLMPFCNGGATNQRLWQAFWNTHAIFLHFMCGRFSIN